MSAAQSSIPTILVTGGNGQIGFELRRSLAPLGIVVAPTRAALDLADPSGLRQFVRSLRPDVIVNAAAYTDVDKAETESDVAFAVNGIAPGVLAEEAALLGSLFVHYSSDYVFGGGSDMPQSEIDPTSPLSCYGASKLAGDQAIAASNAQAIIFRTSWVAGLRGSNFVRTILRLGAERQSLSVVADQFGAPTPAGLLADVTAHVVSRHWFDTACGAVPSGLYNLAASGVTSWHAYAVEVLHYAANHGLDLRLAPSAVKAIPAADYPSAAPRPANSRLDTTKVRKTFGISLPEWQDGIHYLIDQMLAGHFKGPQSRRR